MDDKIELNCSQFRALKRYIDNDYVIIESKRRTGKSTTLGEIFKFWLKYQMKDRDVCVVIGRTYCAVDNFVHNMIENYCKDCGQMYKNDDITIFTRDGRRCRIIKYTNKDDYIVDVHQGKLSGINVALIIGDECYIPPTWCERTACAFTCPYEFTDL